MAQVYWCARNLDSFLGFTGNHHFLVVRLDEGESLPPFTVNEENGTRFVTLAAFSVDGGIITDGRLEFGANNATDVTAVREFLNPGKYKSNWTDYDLAYHLIEPPGRMSGIELARALAKLALAYQKNQSKFVVRYRLNQENCAAWANTILSLAGVDESVRKACGEFSGVDWGEEDTVPVEMFN